jgi:hypothetical protein
VGPVDRAGDLMGDSPEPGPEVGFWYQPGTGLIQCMLSVESQERLDELNSIFQIESTVDLTCSDGVTRRAHFYGVLSPPPGPAVPPFPRPATFMWTTYERAPCGTGTTETG